MKIRLSVLVAIAFAGVISMSSCVKKYTCHCNFVYSGAPGLPDSSYNEYEIKDSKSNAKSKCTGQSGTFDNNGIHTEETCYIY